MLRAGQRRGAAAGIALTLTLAGPARAAERFVKPDADPSCASTPNCHQTITAAAGAAADGDVITIGHNGGIAYVENIAFDGRSGVTFRGEPGTRPEIRGSRVVPGRSSGSGAPPEALRRAHAADEGQSLHAVRDPADLVHPRRQRGRDAFASAASAAGCRRAAIACGSPRARPSARACPHRALPDRARREAYGSRMILPSLPPAAKSS